jgi:integrase
MRLPAEGHLLTEQEIKRIIDAADHPRDKAFVAVLSESGCRISEVCTLRIRKMGVKENLSGIAQS